MSPSRHECEDVLRWAMPVLGLSWNAYRNVRGQVLKRLRRRIATLGLGSAAEYRRRLAEEMPAAAALRSPPPTLPPEWQALAGLCRVTVSRFYRDRQIFDSLRRHVLPQLASSALTRRAHRLRCWCAGCGAGEEVYSLSLVWNAENAPHTLAARYPKLSLEIVGTDAHAGQLQRAQRAVYPRAAWAEAPSPVLLMQELKDDQVRIPKVFRQGVRFFQQGLCRQRPPGPFDLILCRNMAFSYFDANARELAARTLCEALLPGGVLVLGRGEHLPPEACVDNILRV